MPAPLPLPPDAAARDPAQVEQEAYERLYAAIADRVLPPGTKLVEEQLSRVFDISRARVRKVLLRLAHGKLVTLQPNRGASVAQPSVAEARDVFGARRMIEPSLCRLLVERGARAQLPRLQAHVAQEKAADALRDRPLTIRLSGEFHLLLAELAGNAVVSEILRELISRSSLIIAVYESTTSPCCSAAEHEALLARLAGGDGAAAAAFMLEHLDHVEAALNLAERKPERIDLRAALAGAGR